MKKITRHDIVPLLVIAVVACLLLVYEYDLLWKVQEQNLFLCTSLFFKEQMVVPGGLLTWLGTFFTQFLYYPWLGVSLLVVWWLLLVWLVRCAFQLCGWWKILAAIPVLFILVTIVDMGYWVYILKLRGHFFVTTVAATAVTALLWLFRKLSVSQSSVFHIPSSILCILLTCVIGYPLLGIYGLAATLIMAVWTWRLESRWVKALAVSVVGVLSIIIVPLIYYRHVFYQTNLDNIYYAELPLYFIQEEYQLYYVPFYLLLLFFVAMACLNGFHFPGKKEELKPSQKKSSKFSFPWAVLVACLLLISSIAYTTHFWYRDANFHRELAMEHCIERLDWEGVLREAAAQDDEPTRAIVVMRNIALARLGRQSNEMYHYRNGSKRINAPFDMRMMLVAGPLVYYHYGMVNGCYRLSMEMGVEYDWRVEYLKYMARCAVLNGEWQLARKFIGTLKQTTFFDDWADRLGELLEKPDEIANSPEMGFITHMMHYDNMATSDQGYVETFIMKHLTASTYADDPIFQEQALLASMWTKDKKMFWQHFANYIKLHPEDKLPIHVQEAALHFAMQEERPNLDTWPFDDKVRENYRRFREVTPRYNNMEVEPVRKALAPEFGNTYYYDYYLMDNLPQY